MTRPGPKKGYKQSPEHIAKRVRRGSANCHWKGDDAGWVAAHKRAIKAYPTGLCSECGSDRRTLRHHIDENPWNNEPSNIRILCYSCHGLVHSRAKAA